MQISRTPKSVNVSCTLQICRIYFTVSLQIIKISNVLMFKPFRSLQMPSNPPNLEPVTSERPGMYFAVPAWDERWNYLYSRRRGGSMADGRWLAHLSSSTTCLGGRGRPSPPSLPGRSPLSIHRSPDTLLARSAAFRNGRPSSGRDAWWIWVARKKNNKMRKLIFSTPITESMYLPNNL